MTSFVLLPLIIPFITGLLLLVGRNHNGWQKGISLATNVFLVVVSILLMYQISNQGIQVVQLGNWKAPFGIVLAADMLSGVMVFISALVGLTCVLFSFHEISLIRQEGYYYSLFHFLLFGINGAFLTGDLFNLFVFFEVLLMTSYVLLILGNEDKQISAGFSYLTLNLIGSTLFLAGAGILFGLLGTLNMAQISQRIAAAPQTGLITLVGMIFFFVFGLKGAMFPVFNWLPKAYTAPPAPVCALFAGLMTKVGVYSMYRVFGTVFAHDIAFTHNTLLATLAGLTMVIGVFGAVVQYDIRSILAFHSISQVGYILMGLALFSPLAIAAGVFHMIHHSLVKSSLFLIGGGIGALTGTQDLKKLGGLVGSSWSLAVFFIVAAMALAGIPPLSGFFSKFGLVMGGLKSDQYLLVFAALFTGLFTLYSMIKIWRLGFWGEPGSHPMKSKPSRSLLVSTGVSVFVIILLTVFIKPLMTICFSASRDLLNKNKYIEAVLDQPTIPYNKRDEK